MLTTGNRKPPHRLKPAAKPQFAQRQRQACRAEPAAAANGVRTRSAHDARSSSADAEATRAEPPRSDPSRRPARQRPAARVRPLLRRRVCPEADAIRVAARSSLVAMRSASMRQQVLSNGAEVRVMWPHHNRERQTAPAPADCVLRPQPGCRPQKQPPPASRPKPTRRSCRAEQSGPAESELHRSLPAASRQSDRLTHEIPDCSSSAATRGKPLRMARRKHQHKLRIGSEQPRPSFQQRRFLAFKRAARHHKPQPASQQSSAAAWPRLPWPRAHRTSGCRRPKPAPARSQGPSAAQHPSRSAQARRQSGQGIGRHKPFRSR